jgi:hypothetical protein
MNGYAITDSKKAVWVYQDTSGSYSLTTDKGKAAIFGTRPAADIVFNNNLSKLIKSKGVEVKAVKLQIAGADVPKKESAPVPSTPLEFGSSKYIISVLSEAASKLNCRHLELVEEMSKYDRQKSDVEHYIEFNAGKLNACDGFKAYKLLQDILVERRKVKDELQIIQSVKNTMSLSDDIDEKVRELESRTYEPREFAHLFETKEK